MSVMSEMDILVQEFLSAKCEKNRAEEEVNSCLDRMDEIRKELLAMGYTEELGRGI